jgi:hypothetical protein
MHNSEGVGSVAAAFWVRSQGWRMPWNHVRICEGQALTPQADVKIS